MCPCVMTMKLQVTLIDYEYPKDKGRGIPDPLIWDLADTATRHLMTLAFGNGIIVEMRVTGDSAEALNVLRSMALDIGKCRRVELSEEQRARLWLFRDGDECYAQGDVKPGYVFVEPVPKPALVDK